MFNVDFNVKCSVGQVLPARQRTKGRHPEGDGVHRRACLYEQERDLFACQATGHTLLQLHAAQLCAAGTTWCVFIYI